jgi:hypothetical protein
MVNKLRSLTKKTINLKDQKALILKMEELIKLQTNIVEDDAIFFCDNNIYYRIRLHTFRKESIFPNHEYTISRSNIDLKINNYPFGLKKDRIMTVINNNYEPIWYEKFDYYEYIKNANQNYSQNLSYYGKHTFWLDCDDECNTILK